ncbi:hypothetical protein ISX56_30330, partial [Serratia ureilytica]|nr:hypothetical protein [Serratia ureilytica]
TWQEFAGGGGGRRGASARRRGVRLVGLHVTLLDPQLERQLALPWE